MLKGKRVTLRAMCKEDVPLMHRYGQDLELEVLGGGDPPTPKTLEAAQTLYDDKIAKDESGGDFAIVADDKVIGFCGLFRFNWTHRHCELGIGIGDRDYWSKGYGRESIGLLLEYAFVHRNLNKVCLSTHSENLRAMACYRASGFIEEGRLRSQLWSAGKFVDEVDMGILKEEWEKRSESGNLTQIS